MWSSVFVYKKKQKSFEKSESFRGLTKKVKSVKAVKTDSVRAAAIRTVSGSWKIHIDAIR